MKGVDEGEEDVPAGTSGACNNKGRVVCGNGGRGGHGGHTGNGGNGGVEAGSVPAGTSPAPISGSRAERYQVVLHVDARTLAADGDPRDGQRDVDPDRSHLDDGTRVPAETSRRLSCDAAVVRVHHGADGSILDVGRRTRSIPPALRRALEIRDRGCRFPSCGLRFTDGHHVVHWADGGETSLRNTLLLCRHHHGLVHEGGWRVHWWGDGRPVFFDPRGGTHFEGRWVPPRMNARPVGERERRGGSAPDPVAALLEDNRLLGVSPDGWTAGARWKREADIPDAVLFRTAEAMEGGPGA